MVFTMWSLFIFGIAGIIGFNAWEYFQEKRVPEAVAELAPKPSTDVEPLVDPLPNSTYRQQFLRYSQQSRSYLPSLALSGMSCHCIMKVETADTLEVLAMFRSVP